MIQMHLLYHRTSIDDGLTYYEANMHAAYYLIRAGKIIEVVRQRLGEYPAKVITTILYCGHAQVSYLETRPELRPENADEPSTNGNDIEHGEENGKQNGKVPLSPRLNGDHDTHNGRLHAALKALAGHGYICRTRESHFQSLTDHILDAERIARQAVQNRGAKGKDAAALFERIKNETLFDRMDSSIDGVSLVHGIPKGVKRPQANGASQRSNKRRRVGSSDGLEEESEGGGYDDYEDDDDEDEALNVSC